MITVFDAILVLYLLMAPYFYLPHLLTGSTHALGGSIVEPLSQVAIIRDVGILTVCLLYLLFRIIYKGSIRKMNIFFLIYAISVAVRLILHGFSENMLNYIVNDSHYILSIFVPLGFYISNLNEGKIMYIKKSLKFSSLPVVFFLIWEIMNPGLAIWLTFNRYRSTLLSPTVLGQFAGIIFVITILDLIESREHKLLNLIYAISAIVLIFFSGSRTTFLVVILTLMIMILLVGKKTKHKISFTSASFLILLVFIILSMSSNSGILNSRIFDINISGDGRLDRLIYELDNLSVSTLFFGSTPGSLAPLDISWFTILQRLGVIGWLSIIMLNISVIVRLIKKIRITNNRFTNYQFVLVLIFMSINYLFTTNLMNAFPLNLYYWFSLGIGMKYLNIDSS